MLDINFHFKTEGFRRIAEAVGPVGLTWLEIDTHDPQSLALIRRDAPCPIASGETLLRAPRLPALSSRPMRSTPPSST